MRSNSSISGAGFGKVLAAKLKDYHMLVKFRLSFIVVFSAGISYLFSGGAQESFLLFVLGGFLITAASNAINQIIESETDQLMTRTADRPLAAGRMQHTEAIFAAGLMAFAGIALLWWQFNSLSALLGALSLISYAFMYTPMKRVSSVAVFVGAFPGAMPTLIGGAAATGNITDIALLLFCIQFVWQFPHFWSIAWVACEDYAKAGFHLLPSVQGKTRASAIHVVIYAALLVPVSLLMFVLGYTGWISAIIVLICGLIFLYQAVQLYRTCDTRAARSLMFGSFLYLPVVMIALLVDKL